MLRRSATFGSLRLTPEERRLLEEEARKRDLPMSHIIRTAIREALMQGKKPQAVA